MPDSAAERAARYRAKHGTRINKNRVLNRVKGGSLPTWNSMEKYDTFVGRSRARAQKGMTDAQKAEYAAVMGGIRRARPTAAPTPARPAAPIQSSSSTATKTEPRRVGNRIAL